MQSNPLRMAQLHQLAGGFPACTSTWLSTGSKHACDGTALATLLARQATCSWMCSPSVSWLVQALRQLEVLFIPGTFLSERGLHALASLPHLQTLGLECFAEGSPSYLSTLSCLTQLTALQVGLSAPLPDCFGDCLPVRRSC